MEKHEQQRKQNVILGETRAKIDWDDECTFQPPAAKKMPDFVKAQRHFQNLLDKTRSHKKPTQPMPFNFEANKKIPRIDYLENDNERIKRDKDIQLMRQKNQNNLAKVLSKPTDFVPNATKAFTAKVEHTKFDRNKQADKDRAKVNASAERKRRYDENAVKLRQTLALDEAEKRRKIEESQVGKSTKQDEFRKTTAGYQKKLKEIKSNLGSRPPVYQNCNIC